ncbi:MAG: hypothetical protein JSU95_11955 [Betaproteobacteria bacterium]|nr:MAG: hypothetical protein JSU95_11955 [Betaproteobacteria bacterium]
MLDPVTSFQHRPMRTVSSVLQEGVQTLFELLIVSLLLLGIIGFVFKAFGSNGLVLRLLQSAWQGGPGYLLFATAALVISLVWLRRFFYRRPAAIGRGGDVLVFGFLALGAFFGLRLIITGGF